MTFIVSDPYTRPLLRALGIQFLLLALASCGLPQEVFLRACSFASVGFWVGVVVVLIRRPRNPTQGDLAFVRWGLLPVGIIGMVAALLYWTVIGVFDGGHPHRLQPALLPLQVFCQR